MSPFELFVEKKRSRFRLIVWKSEGEYQLGDVVSEAWLMADELSMKLGIEMDFADAEFQDLLMRRLYNRIVKYADKKIRYGTRLDHGKRGGEDTDQQHPLMNILASDDGEDPLSHWLKAEDAKERAHEEVDHPSLAGAYVLLMDHFNNDMRAIADYLLISRSYAYFRCKMARLLASNQSCISFAMVKENFPSPWRRFRLETKPLQLQFDFSEQPSLSIV